MKLKQQEALRNDGNKYLFIYRRGKWDLPKGKVNKGETPYEAALREISEETGLHNVEIIRELINTYHIYKLKDKMVLKKTNWFLMQNNGSDKFNLQIEEGIEKATWIDETQIKTILDNTYKSLKDAYCAYFSNIVH